MNKTVYLAGPISGQDGYSANQWRRGLTHRLSRVGIKGISPLRCEPLLGKRYPPYVEKGQLVETAACPKFGTARAIASKNMFDVLACDITLAYMPANPDTGYSLGTISELAWARAFNKPTILVTNDPYLQGHPVVQANAGWALETLDDAFDVIVGILGDY